MVLLCTAGFDYMTEAGAVAAHVQFQVPAALLDQAQQLQQDVQQQQAAAGYGPQQQQRRHHRQQAGNMARAQKDISSASGSWCTTRDYCNGGPMFVTRQGDVHLDALPGVAVLATYSRLLHRPCLHSSLAQPQGLSRLQEQPQESLVDKEDGSSSTADQSQAHVEGGHACQGGTVSPPAAAVRCQVGQGVAVLCGTHPELEPHWLDVCGRSQEQVRSTATAAEQQRAAGVDGADDPEGLGGAVSSIGSAVGVQQAPAVPAAAVASPLAAEVRPEYEVGSAISVPVVAMLAGTVVSQRQVVGRVKQSWPVHGMGAVSGAQGDAVRTGSGDSSAASSDSQCGDAQLQEHAIELVSTLSAHQQQRDLFLSCLLYEALRGLNKRHSC